MTTSDAQKRANAAWNRRQDNIMIRPSKEEGQRIRAAAERAGQSVQAYILDTLRARMAKDQS
jgi:predicted HicB family RNase H-like nuclease